MRHATAVRRLRRIAESCQQVGRWPGDPPLRAALRVRAVLDSADDLDWVQVAFVVDDPPAEVLT